MIAQQRLEQLESGRYVNRTYGYSVRIPAASSVFVASAGPQRGFILPLSEQPRAFIRVDAAYDVFYDISPAGVHQRDINTVRLHDTLLGDQSVAAQLAGEPASRWSLDFSCHGNPQEFVHESLAAVRYREIYRIDLHTTPQRLEMDVRLFNELVRSWQWEKPR